jgi:lipopolysaccharide/colanic/teichoic acid biosynthesis glycosyltransferase
MAVIRDGGSPQWGRLCDILIACLTIAFCLPLIAAVALAIKADGSGPVLCRRLRIRRDGRWVQTFTFRVTAHHRRWMTRMQPFLCGTRIEMLPQAIDVLRGNLTFIGHDRPGFLLP